MRQGHALDRILSMAVQANWGYNSFLGSQTSAVIVQMHQGHALDRIVGMAVEGHWASLPSSQTLAVIVQMRQGHALDRSGPGLGQSLG